MGVEDLPHVEVESRAAWRAWLAAHHQQRTGIWLVTYKKHCGDRYVPWGDIVREALCFGWIDSRTRRVDEDRTSVLVTPRKPGSVWSAINKRLIEELVETEQMTPAGQQLVDAAKADGSWVWLDEIEALVVPSDLAAALDSAHARAGWDALPPSQRKVLLTRIKSAKRPPTRKKRVQNAVEQSRSEDP